MNGAVGLPRNTFVHTDVSPMLLYVPLGARNQIV